MLEWLGQEGTVDLERGHVYRARWVVMNPIPLVTCASLPVSPIIQQILNLPGTGTAFPADLRVFTTLAGLPADWPADRRDVPGRAASECVVWAEMRAASDVPGFEVNAMQQALSPFGGRLVDFWDETDDVVIRDNQQTGTPTPAPAPTPPPPTTEPPSPPTTQPPASPPISPTTTTKPKKKAAEIVIPWGIGIAVIFGLIRAFRS